MVSCILVNIHRIIEWHKIGNLFLVPPSQGLKAGRFGLTCRRIVLTSATSKVPAGVETPLQRADGIYAGFSWINGEDVTRETFFSGWVRAGGKIERRERKRVVGSLDKFTKYMNQQ